MKNKPEYHLFKIRFIIDICYSFAVSIYYTALIVSYIDPFILFHYKSLFVGTLLSSNIVATRFILGAIISTERLIAIYGPYNATAKSLACLVDAIIATFILNKSSSKQVSIRSVNPRSAVTSDRFLSSKTNN
ncbi:hypothetical protein GCK72_018409 [Caenorhabditis remanei]|uniref:Uncharacterized protein n=1 Tax=Caenorhabditis remanei TaxID=31234 RepID=A0A6A5GB61_CAERE|nr:hypothetical protein GCK72_018409 [Caenorhabditis remanei]KAF1751855.1 hypothetical protein GCK72_018409 [Caenorhabditis remanei]